MRRRSMVLGGFLLGILSLPVLAAEAPIAWQEEFDQANSPKDARIFYENRGSGKNGDAVEIREISNGVLKFGLKFDPARNQDRLSMLAGDCIWWRGMGPKWGPFDLKQYPFVEIKWRGESFEFWYGVETLGGQRLAAYTWPTPARKEKDAQGREWNISVLNIAPDSVVPTPNTAAKLLGINLCAYSPATPGEHVTEFESIRVRAATDEERAAEQRIRASLQNFPKGRWRGFDTFFPFGAYTGYYRNDFESWAGDYEGNYGVLARHRFNYTVYSDEVEIGRFGKGEQAANSFIAGMGVLMDAARATGMKIGAGVFRLAYDLDVSQGHSQLLPITKMLAAAWPNDDVVVSWYAYDEPSAQSLLPITMVIRAIREADPLKRPELVVFNNHDAARAYASYLSLSFWDNYPVLEGSRNPWAIRERARGYRKIMPNVPMWAVLQAFETRPPTPRGSYIRPSDAELRMMAYMAVAEGAKGLIWYIDYTGSGRDEGFKDRTGQPRGGMMATLEDLSRTLVPIGKLLLATEPVDDAKLKVQQLDKPADGKGVVLSVLKHRSLPIHYLVAVNEDLDRVRSAQVMIAAGVAGKAAGVYDLGSLNGANLLKGNTFTTGPLAGGDGRVYFVGDAKAFQSARTRILCERALEDVRSLTPDLTIARRWKLSVRGADAAAAACTQAVRQGDSSKATTAAREAKAALAAAMQNDSEFCATQHALSDICVELAEVSRIAEHASLTPNWWTGRGHPMVVPNPGFLDLSKRYWEVGRSYRDVNTRYMKGETKGLWESLSKTRLNCLKIREDLLAMLRKKLEPATEPGQGG